ncbi:hypothetical protein ACQP2T_63780 (plasmid) [Nonomuraea sp. CA-143628]|uniref:hypothetical protein n=1 Tax=Nonomuraea sp. CA-143628 TaxID=3239997 RepID=UPI003D8FD6C0
MKTARFRSRPVEVEAVRWVGEQNCDEVFAFVGENHAEWADETDHSTLFVPVLLGALTAHPGDWLVKDSAGVVTVMRDAEFTARYELTPEPEPFEPATNYHESVDHLRRDLMKGNAHWGKVAEHYSDIPEDKERVPSEAAAFAAASMAGSYGYTLAAILGYARKYGERVAHDLAFEADEILTNGDFEAMNADILVALAEGAPLPGYITLDPAHGRWGEVPGAHWRCKEHRHTGTWTDAADNAMAAHADAIAHLDRLHPGWRPDVEASPDPS